MCRHVEWTDGHQAGTELMFTCLWYMYIYICVCLFVCSEMFQ